jgi:hypothetical protein
VGPRRHAIWDKQNRKHLFVDHADRGITEAQVTYVVENATDDNIAPGSEASDDDRVVPRRTASLIRGVGRPIKRRLLPGSCSLGWQARERGSLK